MRGIRRIFLGRKRFSMADASTIAAIEAITELNQLEELIERLQDVSTWEELLPDRGNAAAMEIAKRPREDP